MNGSEKRVVIYQDKNGVLFIHPSTKVSNRKYKMKTEVIEYGNIKKDSNEELGGKIRKILQKCD
jgi:hypothetical protein